MKDWLSLVFWIGLCELVGVAATPFTLAAIPGWYATLAKPGFAPPNWVFGPAWTLLYFLMGLAAFLVWQEKKKQAKTALNYFYVQLALNFLWSIFFFGLRSPLLGLVDIIALWVLILLTIRQFQRVSRTAAWLLIPYLLWVSFAVVLNLGIVVLN